MSILDTIVAHKHLEIAQMPDIVQPPACTCDISQIFQNHPVLIGEIKYASPSAGNLAVSGNPAQIAQDYVTGGADMISVLTDERFFKGSFANLQAVRATTDLPLLCKDFILHDKQIRYARFCGADLCLLIVKILSITELRGLKQCVEGLGMQAVIEIQTADELQIALSIDPQIILLNNRNLTDFTIDRQQTIDLLELIPQPIKAIVASDIHIPDDCRTFPARTDGFLIGTALMQCADKIGFLQACRA